MPSLLDKVKEIWDTMSPAEREAMLRQQAKSYAQSLKLWPKPRYKWVDGVKVYESYEDYCND